MILRRCSMVEFNNRSRNKCIACYGIGHEFERIIQNYIGAEWTSRIKYLVDGDKRKKGKRVHVDNYQGVVMTLDDFLKQDYNDTVIFITSVLYAEIVENLNNISELNDVECYLYHFMFGLSEHISISIRTQSFPIIPKVIHYCWFGKQDIPDKYKNYMKTWRKFCPDYEIKRWDENNCDIDETKFTRKAYDCGKYSFVSDYFRLKAVYDDGGIYLDTDVEIIKSLDDLRYNESFCGLQYPGEAAFGLGFGAKKNNHIIKMIMDEYYNMDFIPDSEIQNEIPCPIIQSRVLHRLGMEYGDKMQIVQGMTIYPIEVLSPRNLNTLELNITTNTYTIHHYEGSWTTGKRREEMAKRLNDVDKIKKLFVNEDF